MDAQLASLVQAVLVLAAFAAVNERLVEILRGTGKRLASPWVDTFTIGRFSVAPALVLSLATEADLLSLFHKVNGHDFFGLYMSGYSQLSGVTWPGWAQHITGCVLMAFSTTLGSQFWHDLGGGLIDFRRKLTDVAKPI